MKRLLTISGINLTVADRRRPGGGDRRRESFFPVRKSSSAISGSIHAYGNPGLAWLNMAARMPAPCRLRRPERWPRPPGAAARLRPAHPCPKASRSPPWPPPASSPCCAALAYQGHRLPVGATRPHRQQASRHGTPGRARQERQQARTCLCLNVKELRDREIELTQHAERAYERFVKYWQLDTSYRSWESGRLRRAGPGNVPKQPIQIRL